jgi:hypothetical protein
MRRLIRIDFVWRKEPCELETHNLRLSKNYVRLQESYKLPLAGSLTHKISIEFVHKTPCSIFGEIRPPTPTNAVYAVP